MPKDAETSGRQHVLAENQTQDHCWLVIPAYLCLLNKTKASTSRSKYDQLYVPDQSREGQQLAEGQRDKANAGRSGRGPAGHQLQELLCLFICRSVEGSQ